MQRHYILILGRVAAVVAAVTFTAGVLVAQTPERASGPMTGAPVTHEQMHQMMDAMHGEGFSERMHEAMPGSEEMMEQCVGMMNMMGHMHGMMGGQRDHPMPGMGGMMGR